MSNHLYPFTGPKSWWYICFWSVAKLANSFGANYCGFLFVNALFMSLSSCKSLYMKGKMMQLIERSPDGFVKLH